jgi:EcsC family protein
MNKDTPDVAGPRRYEVASKIGKVILDFLSNIPGTSEAAAASPLERSRAIANDAALKASIVSASLALPPGPAGIVTILPDLVLIWKIQAQMVADIAGAFGKQACLTREQMLYCLFRHAAAQAVRDLVVRVGERVLIRRVTLRVLQAIARKVGVKITQRVIAKSVARWLPIVGAVGVGAYAYYDTAQVAATAIELFQTDIDIEGRSREDRQPSNALEPSTQWS